MRYALDARTLTPHFPGIGRYVGNLARALAHEIEGEERLLILWNPEATPHWDGKLPAGENVEWVEAPVSPFSLRQQWLLPRILRRAGASLYHSPYYLMPYFVGLPTVLTLYDSIPEQYPESVPLATRLFSRLATKLALRSASHIITPSRASCRDLLQLHRLEPERVTVIPLAASPHLRPRPEAEQRRVREKLGLPQTYVLYLGTTKPHKNLEGLIAAWETVEEKVPEPPTLVIAGAGDTGHQALSRADSARILGEVEETDLAALLSGATLFVFPSLCEGFGLPIIEAMACGAAVLCSDGSSLTEITADAALHFDPAQPQNLTETICRALANETLRVDLARRGLAQASRFSWWRTASLTLATYRKVLGALES